MKPSKITHKYFIQQVAREKEKSKGENVCFPSRQFQLVERISVSGATQAS